MGGRENYQINMARRFEEILEACHWYPVTSHVDKSRLWEKGRSRLYVDEIGVFLYRRWAGSWVRVAGLAHLCMAPVHLRERMLKFPDNIEIDLITGN